MKKETQPPQETAESHTEEQRIHTLETQAAQMGIKLPPVGRQRKYFLPGYNPLDGRRELKFSDNPRHNLTLIMRMNWLAISLATLFAVISRVIVSLVPKQVGDSLDIGLAEGYSADFWSALILLSVMVLLLGANYYINSFLHGGAWHYSYQTTVYSLFSRTLRRILSVRAKYATGESITTFTDDVFQIAHLTEQAINMIGSITIVATTSYLMLQVSVPLGLMVLIFMPLTMGILSVIVPKLTRRRSAQREAQGELTSLMTDMIGGLRVLRGLGGEGSFAKRYHTQNAQVLEKGVEAARSYAQVKLLERNLPSVLLIAVIGFGAILVFHKQLTPGQLLAFYGYAILLREPIRQISWMITTLTRSWIGAKKVTGIAMVEGKIKSIDYADTPLDWDTCNISDATSKAVINGGEITALVCADTERLNELMESIGRFTDNPAISFNNVNTLDIPITDLRANLIISTAQNHLFAGTLRENVLGAQRRTPAPRHVKAEIYQDIIDNESRVEAYSAPAWPHPNDDAIRHALHLADAHDVLNGLVGELDGLISERGRSISGGQRQRVALARALYANLPILLLVEPTSAVDSHTESRIATNLRVARKGKTTVVVTASPIMLEICDRVIVFDALGEEKNLQMLGTGTHHELMSAATPAAREYQAVVSRAMGEETSDSAANLTQADAAATPQTEGKAQ